MATNNSTPGTETPAPERTVAYAYDDDIHLQADDVDLSELSEETVALIRKRVVYWGPADLLGGALQELIYNEEIPEHEKEAATEAMHAARSCEFGCDCAAVYRAHMVEDAEELLSDMAAAGPRAVRVELRAYRGEYYYADEDYGTDPLTFDDLTSIARRDCDRVDPEHGNFELVVTGDAITFTLESASSYHYGKCTFEVLPLDAVQREAYEAIYQALGCTDISGSALAGWLHQLGDLAPTAAALVCAFAEDNWAAADDNAYRLGEALPAAAELIGSEQVARIDPGTLVRLLRASDEDRVTPELLVFAATAALPVALTEALPA